ncbi:hypothetical protein Bca101_057569 [Brassica carinata]
MEGKIKKSVAEECTPGRIQLLGNDTHPLSLAAIRKPRLVPHRPMMATPRSACLHASWGTHHTSSSPPYGYHTTLTSPPRLMVGTPHSTRLPASLRARHAHLASPPHGGHTLFSSPPRLMAHNVILASSSQPRVGHASPPSHEAATVLTHHVVASTGLPRRLMAP